MEDIARYNAHTLIVGMSATALDSEQEEAFDYGMHFFCTKPVNLDILSTILASKRDLSSLEEVIDRIHNIAQTEGAEETVSLSHDAANPSSDKDLTVSGVNNSEGTNKSKWTLFRSFRNRKVHPDSPTKL